jgi:molecular chaperone GrpE
MAKTNKKTKDFEVEIEKLTIEKNKYLDIAQRAQADLVNFRKKINIDLEQSEIKAQRKILYQIINIIDQMNMALTAKVNTKTYKSWIQGIDSINKNFISMLSTFNFVELNCNEGDKFDPNIHEAISKIETDDIEEGQIVDQISPGYIHKDYLLRPILVSIAQNKEK